MAVSPAVRRYYAERIFAQTTREQGPPNFRPLDRRPTGVATVEGCRGGGKNILEVFIVVCEDRVEAIWVACGLCNPAMLVAADIVVEWARGRSTSSILELDPLREDALAPFFLPLGDDERPDDAREKLQYALVALQHAVLNDRGERTPPLPEIRALEDDGGA